VWPRVIEEKPPLVIGVAGSAPCNGVTTNIYTTLGYEAESFSCKHGVRGHGKYDTGTL